MTVQALIVGDSYRSKATDFLRLHGVPDGVDFVITNLDGDKVSLYLKYANGKFCPSKLTIAKPYFGGNFEQDVYAPINKSYAHGAHYYPAVDPASMPIFPSSRSGARR
jgi:hypothetical protein